MPTSLRIPAEEALQGAVLMEPIVIWQCNVDDTFFFLLFDPAIPELIVLGPTLFWIYEPWFFDHDGDIQRREFEEAHWANANYRLWRISTRCEPPFLA